MGKATQIISASINLDKLDRSKAIPGQKGTWLNVDILISDEPDQYGKNVTLCEPQTREDREAKKPRTYLGNGKTVWKK